MPMPADELCGEDDCAVRLACGGAGGMGFLITFRSVSRFVRSAWRPCAVEAKRCF